MCDLFDTFSSWNVVCPCICTYIYIYIFVYLRIVWNGDNEGLCGGRSRPHCQQTAMTSWACIPDKQT